jgi:propanol-preferring alcohol dehydrogenase
MAETLPFAAEGKREVVIVLQTSSAINSIFDRLEHGAVVARVVPDFLGVAPRAEMRARP